MNVKNILTLSCLIFLGTLSNNTLAQNRPYHMHEKDDFQSRREDNPESRELLKGKTIRFKDRLYLFDNGLFYKPSDGRYIKITPPIGIHVPILPKDIVEVTLGTSLFYFFDGIYYVRTVDNQYEVVNPPVGAIIDQLPEGAVRTDIDGKVYWEYNGCIYKKAFTEEHAFKMVKPNTGTIVNNLSDRARKINIDGTEYWEEDRSLYKEVVISSDGYEVVGDLGR